MATTEGESSGKVFTHPNKTIFTHNKYTLIFFLVSEARQKVPKQFDYLINEVNWQIKLSNKYNQLLNKVH